jgi:hypothetical protein
LEEQREGVERLSNCFERGELALKVDACVARAGVQLCMAVLAHPQQHLRGVLVTGHVVEVCQIESVEVPFATKRTNGLTTRTFGATLAPRSLSQRSYLARLRFRVSHLPTAMHSAAR